nr:acetyltransferase [Raoultella sp. NCTC 9187]
MLIRVEIGIDAPGIDALLRRTFGGDAERSWCTIYGKMA